MNTKTITLTAATLVAGGLLLGTSAVNAYRGNPSVQGPNYDPERHEAMEQALETNNYEAWKELMAGKGRVTSVITAENFSRFAEAHNLAEAGKLDEARAIRQELGLGLKNGSGQGQRGQGQGWNR